MPTDASTRGRQARAYGHETERMAVRYLRDHGFPDACTTRSKLGTDGTRTPGDIDFAPGVALEVKGVKRSGWPEWREQALRDAAGRVPLVLWRTRGVADVGFWRCQFLPIDLELEPMRVVFCQRTRRTWGEALFRGVVTELAVHR